MDAALIAGDVYQRNAPSAEAMTVFSDFITELAKRSLPCYIISGNHDSAERVAYPAQLSGVYISGTEPTRTPYEQSKNAINRRFCYKYNKAS